MKIIVNLIALWYHDQNYPLLPPLPLSQLPSVGVLCVLPLGIATIWQSISLIILQSTVMSYRCVSMSLAVIVRSAFRY